MTVSKPSSSAAIPTQACRSGFLHRGPGTGGSRNTGPRMQVLSLRTRPICPSTPFTSNGS